MLADCLYYIDVLWARLPWVLVGALVLEALIGTAGLSSAWLFRKVKRPARHSVATSPWVAFSLGVIGALVALVLLVALAALNTWVAVCVHSVVAAFLLDIVRLTMIGGRLGYFWRSGKTRAAGGLLGAFVGRPVAELDRAAQIGLLINTSTYASVFAFMTPLLALAVGGLPLMVLVKTCAIAYWRRNDPFAKPKGVALWTVRPIRAFTLWLMGVLAALRGETFVLRPIGSGAHTELELRRQHSLLLLTAWVWMFVLADVLVAVRLVRGAVGV